MYSPARTHANRRLCGGESDRSQLVVAAYQRGGAVSDLARDFGISRDAVYAHLERHGIELRETELHGPDQEEAARLYTEGWSLARLSNHLGASTRAVRDALDTAGVPLRPRRGWR